MNAFNTRIPIITLLVAFLTGVLLIVSFGLCITGGILSWSNAVNFGYIGERAMYISEHVFVNFEEDSADVGEQIRKFIEPFAIFMFALGLVLLFISLLGILATIKNSKILFIMYGIALAAFAFVHFVLLMYYFVRKDIPEEAAEDFIFDLVQNYEGLHTSSKTSLLLSSIMYRFYCCGFDNGEDFKNTGHFVGKDMYDSLLYTGLQYPISCCKMSNDYQILFKECPNQFNDTNSNIHFGCRYKWSAHVLEELNRAAYLSLLILFLVCAILALLPLRIMNLSRSRDTTDDMHDPIIDNLEIYQNMGLGNKSIGEKKGPTSYWESN